jgi:single-strand DNA-binding protein
VYEPLNEVRLRGRLGATIRESTMPSGDTMTSFVVIVERSAKARRSHPRSPTVDALGCTAWAPGPRRAVSSSEPGDIVEVEGMLRRRFRRGGGVPTSWYDVEATKVRRLKV